MRARGDSDGWKGVVVTGLAFQRDGWLDGKGPLT